MTRENLMNRLGLLRSALALAMVSAVAACSGGGADTEVNPVTMPSPISDYTGPAPANADVQAFKVNVWDNIKANNRCGSCHTAGGAAPIAFARTDDVNLAYQAANTVVTLTQPDQSRMVTKVAGGHNCWLSADSACGDTLTVWIRNWAGATATGGRTIQLQAPPIKDVGASRTFPPGSSLFASTLWGRDAQGTYLQRYCARCHSSNAAMPQSPFFAGSDPDDAYEAAKAKINLDNPALSRFVVRLREEFHNCWTDCATAANQMEAAVTEFANAITPTQVDPSLVLSKALTLYDGTVAAGGNRYDTNVIALYEFKTGMGSVAFDTSGVEPALNLTMSGDVTWMGGWGLNVRTGGKAQGTTVASKKLADMIKSTGEFSVEAWAANANVAQEDAYLVSYSAGTMARNFTLAQREYQYEILTRSNRTDANGAPSMLTEADDEDAQASLQHIVITYSPATGRRIYVNGVDTGDRDAQGGGSLADWDDTFAFVLGNETSTNRQWQGVLRLVAVHNRALTQAQIQQNYDVGVGERYFMLFSVAHLTSVPQSYIMFEASQLDSYGYLFAKPTFISLDPTAQVSNLPLRGVRIGLNGAEAKVGQAYIPLNATVGGSSYSSSAGQKLADVGTVIALEKGPENDEFFLSFEQIATNSKTYVDPPPPAEEPPPASAPQPQYGVRTFDKLNQTMSEMTGVPTTNAAVAATFNTVRQQLPTVESIDAFLASHQTAVAQLAIQYCDQLVDGPGVGSFFPGLNLSAQADTYFASQANRDLVINPLLARLVGTNIGTQGPEANIRLALEDTTVDPDTALQRGLIPRLASGPNGGVAGRTALVTKAACAAVLGSATTLVH